MNDATREPRHGANRIWALVGSSVWLVVLAVMSFRDARITVALLACLAIPYAALLWRLDRTMRRAPRVVFAAELLELLGAFLLYLWILFRVQPEWGAAVLRASDPRLSMTSLLWMGGTSLIAGIVVRAFPRQVTSRYS